MLCNNSYHYYIYHLSAYYVVGIILKTSCVFRITTIPLLLITPNDCYNHSFITTTTLWAVGTTLLLSILKSPLQDGDKVTSPVVGFGVWKQHFKHSLCSSPNTALPLIINPRSNPFITAQSMELRDSCGYGKKAFLFQLRFVIAMRMFAYESTIITSH